LKFLFRLDFGPKIGWGHLSRSLGIASALAETGSEVVIATQSRIDGHPSLKNLLDSKGLEVRSITSSKTIVGSRMNPFLDVDNQVSDAIETLKISSMWKADIVVLDHYGLGPTWIETVRASSPVCLISDFPAETEVDYLLDYGFDATAQKHSQGTGSGTKLMLGTAFAPISNSYSRFMTPPNEDNKERSRVLVSLGGFGEETLARQVVQVVEKERPEALIHIAGDPSKYGSLSLDYPAEKLTIAHEASLAPQFEISGTAIVGAGVTMYELVASGSLGLAIRTAKNQEFALSAALEKGYVRGVQEVSSSNIIQKVAQELAHQSRIRKREWLKARSLVDHLGPKRLALKLTGHSSIRRELREVRISDLPFLLRLANQPSSQAASPKPNFIESAEHWEWSKGFFDGSKRGWVFGTNELPLGHCRLEREGSDLFLSYSIQEEFHGEGLGAAMLKALFEPCLIAEKVYARVKVHNVASIKALSKVGFMSIQGEGELITMVRET